MRSLALMTLILMNIGAVRGASIPAGEQPGFREIRAEDLKANLTFLASDALEGRMSLGKSSEVAIQWIQSEFQKAGLEPAANGSYLQPVPLFEYRNDRAQSFSKVDIRARNETFQFPEAFGQFSENTDISAPLVFAG